ncbi:PREDICTED: RILP-like protein 2 [Fulmarus glacialis]|uniref:RILP-like protein 2 n=1 Tax=Fulmarus glacialis TaxID=30455 RepID=UPI00051AEFC2|nr:PREDICTED: RILP-like protein 2 [Fulmarus glacialis]
MGRGCLLGHVRVVKPTLTPDVSEDTFAAFRLGPDKMVIDLTDPNRPRFTLQELRDVLQERNQLKAQLLVVQEELQCYKSGIISQRRDQTEELEKEASGSSPGTSKDSEEKTIIKRLFSFKHGK